MDRRYDIVTFDCYGTLIDWESGIADAFTRAAAADGVTLQRQDILSEYAHIEPEVQHENYRPYREVLIAAAQHVARALGWTTDGAFLPESLPSWTPFPDTNLALERLRAAGYRIGVLSNIDDDLFAMTRRHFTVDLDLLVTAQQVRSYKPGHAHFNEARQRIGDACWLHAAQSNFHDIVPANTLGIPSAWVNRHGETARQGGVPAHEVRDMARLADLLGA